MPTHAPDPPFLPAAVEEACANLPVEVSQHTAAAVLPSTCDTLPEFATLNSPETEDSASDVSPSAFPHLIWKASAFGRDEFPDVVECMLDSGANLKPY